MKFQISLLVYTLSLSLLSLINCDQSSINDPSEVNLIKPIVNKRGRFENPWSQTEQKGITDMLKWKLFGDSNTSLPEDSKLLDKTLPVHYVSKKEIEDFCMQNTTNKVRIIWIGHSTLLLNIENKIVLVDPLFSERASPFRLMGPKRYRPVPLSIKDIPRIDAVVVSHNHYDHLDIQSVEEINEKFKNNDVKWFVGTGLGEWFRSNDVVKNVYELNWWESMKVSDLEFFFVPAQHWSGRGVFDRNKSLWGGWVILGKQTKIYLVGDTGYCSVFKDIGKRFGPFDVSFIPIGAYEPRWIMSKQHVNPEEAVLIHLDAKSKKSFGIHWGTFAMTDEHYLEPKDKLAEYAKKYGLGQEEFQVLKHGYINEL